MRPDQLARLAELSVKLADVFLEEADPETWPGEGAAIAAMTTQERGDRYWSKKNAAATLTLLCKIEQIQAAPGAPVEEVNFDKAVKAAERQAARMLDKISAAKH